MVYKQFWEKPKISMLIEKGPLDSMATKDKGKAAITAIDTLHLTEPCSSAFTTTPNHSRYGLMEQVSVLEKSILHVDEG